MLQSEWLGWIDNWSNYGWFLLLPILERLFPTRPIGLRHRGIVSDVLYTFDPLIKPAFVVFGVEVLQFLLPSLSSGLLRIPQSWPLWVHVPIVILISEFSFYWVHRLTHMSAFLWEFHRVHHSSTSYQSLMTSRFHPVDSLLFVAPYLFAIHVFGVDVGVVFWFGVFQSFMDRYGHSNINGPRWTGYFITTPHFHAWHHCAELRAWNTNFSRDFVFFDYLFGSAFYPKDEVPVEFGEPDYPAHFHLQFIKPFTELWGRYVARKTG
jgi:sterol desaturase/sphingolipid hydroxylase (fatty acid hydroxylase superfamily)